MKATVSGVFGDLKFKISEGSVAETASKVESGQLQFWSEPSEISKLRSSNTPKTVAFTIPWCLKNPVFPDLYSISS